MFEIGDRVYVTNPNSAFCNEIGYVIANDHEGGMPYDVEFSDGTDIPFKESELDYAGS